MHRSWLNTIYAHTSTPAHYTNVVIGWVVEARAGVPDRLEVSLRLVQRAAEYCLPLRQEVQVAEKAEHLSCARFCVWFVCVLRDAGGKQGWGRPLFRAVSTVALLNTPATARGERGHPALEYQKRRTTAVEGFSRER